MATISGGRRGERRCLRRPGASGVGRLGEEEERDEAELVGVSERRGGGGGREGSEGQRRWRSAGCVREGRRRGETMGDVEGVPGVSWRRLVHRGGARQAGREGVEASGALASTHLCLLAEVEEDQGAPGGLG